jgi:hypothetical protein
MRATDGSFSCGPCAVPIAFKKQRIRAPRGAENQHVCQEVLASYRRRSSHNSLVASYITDSLTFIMLIKFFTDSSPVWYSYCIFDCGAP